LNLPQGHIELRIREFLGRRSRGIKCLLLVAGCWLLVPQFDSFAQTGPGGVGNSINNLLWLKADYGVTTAVNGSPVSIWLDQSGNANNANQGIVNLQPKYISSATNGKPAILFNNLTDGIYDYLNLASGFSNFTGGISALIVVRPIAAGNWDNFLNLDISSNPTFENIGLMRYAANNDLFYDVTVNSISNGSLTGTNAITNGSYQIFGFRQNGGTPPSTSTARLYRNNAFLTTGTVNIPTNIVRDHNYIGHDSWGTGDMTAEIAEIIIYNFTMNRAQNYIIENYLSSKYGIALASNDYFSWDATYGNDVAGIGRLDASNLHDNATSAGILNLSTPSGLGNGDYLLFGHDNGSITSWTGAETPSSGIMKLPREWRLSETNDIGTASFTFDVSLLPAPPDATCVSYVLLIDADGNFNAGSTVLDLTSLVGNLYRRTLVSTVHGDYVTIGVRRAPTASITPDPAQMCVGGTLNMNGNPTGGSGTYTTHAWTGNTSPLSATNIQNPTFSTTSAGTYNLTYTVTDERGCTGSDNISVTV